MHSQFMRSRGWPFLLFRHHLEGIGSPLEDLFVAFCRILVFCWIALTLKQKPIFSGLGDPRSAPAHPLFRVLIPGGGFARF